MGDWSEVFSSIPQCQSITAVGVSFTVYSTKGGGRFKIRDKQKQP